MPVADRSVRSSPRTAANGRAPQPGRRVRARAHGCGAGEQGAGGAAGRRPGDYEHGDDFGGDDGREHDGGAP